MDLLHEIFERPDLHSRIDYIEMSRKGIRMRMLKKIAAALSLSMREIAGMLPVSERQLSRYKDDQVLKKEISSHLIQLVELFERGYEVFGKDKFNRWIRSENAVLENRKPIDLLDTAIGIQTVADVIGRIEHGVYS